MHCIPAVKRQEIRTDWQGPIQFSHSVGRVDDMQSRNPLIYGRSESQIPLVSSCSPALALCFSPMKEVPELPHLLFIHSFIFLERCVVCSECSRGHDDHERVSR
jgi:hypothetical protein